MEYHQLQYEFHLVLINLSTSRGAQWWVASCSFRWFPWQWCVSPRILMSHASIWELERFFWVVNDRDFKYPKLGILKICWVWYNYNYICINCNLLPESKMLYSATLALCTGWDPEFVVQFFTQGLLTYSAYDASEIGRVIMNDYWTWKFKKRLIR